VIQGLWQSTAGLSAMQLRQDMLSNNLANAETPGFKPDWITLTERVAPIHADETLGDGPRLPYSLLDPASAGLSFSAARTDFSPGAIVVSDNPLDLAVDGNGFLSVRTDQGVRYTRDGRMTTRADGALVSVTGGWEVLDADGEAVRIDRSSNAPLQIDASGRVRQGDVLLGELAFKDFADRSRLRKTGGNLFDASDAQPIEPMGQLRQGMVEGSGVNPITDMVRMIEASRAYQLNASLITLQDQTLGRAVNDVGRLA